MEAIKYYLNSKSLDKYYVGHNTEPIETRLRKHLSCLIGFTSKAKDWRIEHTELYPNKRNEYQRESEIKKYSLIVAE